jgi:hypothetical protein
VVIVQSNTKVHSFRLKAKEYSQPTMASSVKRPSSMRAGKTVWIIDYSVIGDVFVYDNMDGKALRDGHMSLKETILL